MLHSACCVVGSGKCVAGMKKHIVAKKRTGVRTQVHHVAEVRASTLVDLDKTDMMLSAQADSQHGSENDFNLSVSFLT